MVMAPAISFSGSNSGLQVGDNHGQITAQFYVSENVSTDKTCLRDLQTTNPRHDKNRIQTAKGGLLKDVYSWILDHANFKRWLYEQESQLLWIKGDPGKGKTMLLCGIIDELSELTKSAPETTAICFFFCQATDPRINHATAVLRGLIFMLVDQQPFLISHIRRQYDKTGKQVFEGVNAWEALSEILTSMLEDPLLQTTYLIIDALDECTTGLDRLLELVALKSSACPHVKWIVSSRNWPAIEETLDAAARKTKLWLELNEASVSKAVAAFIHYKVQKLAEKKKYDNETRHAVSKHLLSNSQDTFLWVALVCEKLTNVPKRNVRKKLEEFPAGLDKLYKRMLDQIGESDDAELCKSLLGIITTLHRPITLDELLMCIDLPEEILDNSDLAEIIGICGAFLSLRESTVSLVHQSAKDFLLQEAAHEIFPDGEDIVHYSIFSKSLGAISRTLRRDIYGLVHPGYPIDRVNRPDPDPLAAIRYACVYWVDHLSKCYLSKNANEDLQDSGSVGIFFRQEYLHWLEALSLSRSLSEGVASMLRLEGLLKKTTENSQLLSRVQDACRFVLYHKTTIENQPLQTYSSGLIFSPVGSLTRIQYKTQEPDWIIGKPSMEEKWSACQQTLEGHQHRVYSIIFSHDSKLLASASDDNTVKVWNAGNGQCLQTLKDHDGRVNSVVFSHDSKLLASASDDGTVKVWDTSNGQHLQTLKGHDGKVRSVIFSHDSKLFASASFDYSIKIWDVSNAQHLQTLKGHDDWVQSVIFSHDSKLLASTSSDNSVKVWDASNGKCLQTLKCGYSRIYSTFSNDSTLLAATLADDAVKVWNAGNGQCLQTLKNHDGRVNSVVFSHDSKLLASASDDGTVKVWDTSNGQHLQTLKGHETWVTSVIFSHDSKLLASTSFDHSIKIWNASNGQCLQTLKGHEGGVNSVVFSHDSKLLASASDDNTIKVWDSRNGQNPQKLECHQGWVYSVIFSHDSKLVASASFDRTVKIWDASNGQCLRTLKGHDGRVRLAIFSHDSKLLGSSSDDDTVKVWDATNGQCLQTLKGHQGRFNSIAFSRDSRLLAFTSADYTIKVFDTSNGRHLKTLKGHDGKVKSVIFSHDSKLLASASNDCTVIVWDVSSGQHLQMLRGHKTWVSSVIFSPDSKLLASASDEDIVKIWDTSNGQCLQTINVGIFVRVKSFEKFIPYLETDYGPIHISLGSGTELTKTDPDVLPFQGYGVSSGYKCITWNSEKLLWLPPEYRSKIYAVSLSTMCLGYASGRVLFFTFDAQRLLHSPSGH